MAMKLRWWRWRRLFCHLCCSSFSHYLWPRSMASMRQHIPNAAEPNGRQYGSRWTSHLPRDLWHPSSVNGAVTREHKSLESWATHDSVKTCIVSGKSREIQREKKKNRKRTGLFLTLYPNWDTWSGGKHANEKWGLKSKTSLTWELCRQQHKALGRYWG